MYVAAVNKINKSDLTKRECGREGKKTMVLRAQNTHCTRVYSFRQKRKCLCALTHTHTDTDRHPCTHFHFIYKFYFYLRFYNSWALSLSLSLVEKVFEVFLWKLCVCALVLWIRMCFGSQSHYVCVSFSFSVHTLAYMCTYLYTCMKCFECVCDF